MKKFFHEFKEFISRGNVMDMAIGAEKNVPKILDKAGLAI